MWPRKHASREIPRSTTLHRHDHAAKCKRRNVLPRAGSHKSPQPVYFTQEDPIGLAGGLNLYGYAGGDPINFSDPFGLCPACPPPVPGGTDRSGVGEYGSPRPWKNSAHAGQDVLGNVGDPVNSPVSGKVVFVRNDVGAMSPGKPGQEMGNGVMIQFEMDDGGTGFWRGGHLGTVNAKVGQPVTAGQRVGTVGASGNAAVAGPGRTPLPMVHSEYRTNSGAGFSGSVNPATVSPKLPCSPTCEDS